MYPQSIFSVGVGGTGSILGDILKFGRSTLDFGEYSVVKYKMQKIEKKNNLFDFSRFAPQKTACN